MNWEIIHIDETDSTNRWLRDRQQATANDCASGFSPDVRDVLEIRDVPVASVPNAPVAPSAPIAVVAEYQTAGRGCGTNTWESERGKNLTFSLLLHPTEALIGGDATKPLPAARQFAISEWISIALCETLEHYIYNKVEIKWPNDIYVEGKKIAGILIENRLQGDRIKDSIIGIGLNVNQQVFHSDAPNPVSLRQLLGHDVDREELLHEYLRLVQCVPTTGTMRTNYWNRLYQRLAQSWYSDQNGRFQATITGVEPDGRLVMTDSDGRERRYAFKEVTFIL